MFYITTKKNHLYLYCLLSIINARIVFEASYSPEHQNDWNLLSCAKVLFQILN